MSPPAPPPDSRPPRKRRPASLSDTIDEVSDRDRAATAAIERDVRAGLTKEQPQMATPRTRTPAEDALRKAVDEIRRLSPEWHVAEQFARALDAITDELVAERTAAEAERTRLVARLTSLEAYPAAAARVLSRFKAAIAGSLLTALGAIAAVLYGAGVKSGHRDAEQAQARVQAAAVVRHDHQIRTICDRGQGRDSRLDEHDHLLGLPSRRRDSTDDCGATP